MSSLQKCFFPLVELSGPPRDTGRLFSSRLSGWLPPLTVSESTARDRLDERDAEIHRLRVVLEQKQQEIDVLAEALDYARTLLSGTSAC